MDASRALQKLFQPSAERLCCFEREFSLQNTGRKSLLTHCGYGARCKKLLLFLCSASGTLFWRSALQNTHSNSD